jgi:hypothetical protein
MMSRIAFGPRAGQKVLTVQGAMPRAMVFDRTLCADIDGVGLHTVRAAGRMAARRWNDCAATSPAPAPVN